MRAVLASVVLACGAFAATPAWAQLDPCLADPVACVGETVEDATGTDGETVQGTTETVTDTVGGLTGSGGGGQPDAPGVTGGGSGESSSEPARDDGGSSGPDRRSERRSERSPVTGGDASTAVREAGAPPQAISREATPDALQRIRRAFSESAGAFVFPLALIGLVGGFLLLQSRVDRSDPKLALAPIDARDEALEFR